MTTRVALYFHPGDDETRVFKYLDSTGTVVNLTGYTAIFSAVVGSVLYSTSGTVNGAAGTVSVLVPDTQTTLLGNEGWNGSYEVTVTSSGGVDTTIAEGPLVLLGE